MPLIISFDNTAQLLAWWLGGTGPFAENYVIDPPDSILQIYMNGGDDALVLDEDIGNLQPYNMQMYGGSGNDTLCGNIRSDTLDGGIGDDVMYESKGDDVYYVDGLGDQIIEATWFTTPNALGNDTVVSTVDYALSSFLENLTLAGSGDLNGFGNFSRNILTGNSGANILDGLQGADTLIGGGGDDVYVIDSGFDVVVELSSEGTDIVETGVSYSLPAFVEQGFLNSAGRNQSLTGNSLGNLLVGNSGLNSLSGLGGKDELRGEGGSDSLYGGAGIDTLDGGTGADRMEGGADNDIYYVDNGLDLVVEAADGGYDTVFTSTAIALPDNVEKLVFNGFSDGTMLSGNDLANYLQGNYTDDIIDVGAGNDQADGGSGNDTLIGGSGNDTLLGAFGIDSIEGGLGRDILTGGAGADLFVFVAVTDSTGNTRDLIKDFEAGLDRIDLRQIDAAPLDGNQAFAFIGNAAFTAAGQVRYATTATTTRIEVSIDADTDPEFTLLLNGVHSLTEASFLL